MLAQSRSDAFQSNQVTEKTFADSSAPGERPANTKKFDVPLPEFKDPFVGQNSLEVNSPAFETNYQSFVDNSRTVQTIQVNLTEEHGPSSHVKASHFAASEEEQPVRILYPNNSRSPNKSNGKKKTKIEGSYYIAPLVSETIRNYRTDIKLLNQIKKKSQSPIKISAVKGSPVKKQNYTFQN